MSGDERILLGRIVAAHGIRGDVLIRTYTGQPEAIGSYGPVAAGDQSVKVRVVRVTPKGVVARLSGVVDRNAAEALAGTDLFVERARLPAANADEFYHADLIGLTAVDPDGAEIGRVVGVYNFGAGDLLDVAFGGSRRTELIPFKEPFVPTVDLAARRVVIVLPEPGEPDPEDQDEGSGSIPPQA
jgi:16S rRNA processing protein RimM